MRILLIEDEDEIADFLVRGLREEGHTVDRAADGLAGSRMARTEPWDLVLLDWWLPGIDGLEVLGQLRATDTRTPVLFLTARDAVTDRVTGLDRGADDYLCKPFAFAELLARVRALTRRADGRPGTRLAYADVAADLATQRGAVDRGDVPHRAAARARVRREHSNAGTGEVVPITNAVRIARAHAEYDDRAADHPAMGARLPVVRDQTGIDQALNVRLERERRDVRLESPGDGA